jgi:hypothetical protein
MLSWPSATEISAKTYLYPPINLLPREMEEKEKEEDPSRSGEDFR